VKKLVFQVNIPVFGNTLPNNDKVFLSTVGNKTFRYREDLYKLSEQQAKIYAAKCDADYLQITDCNFLPNKHPIYQRLKMFELDEYDQILYLDSDAIVMDDAPSIFDLYGHHPISALCDIPPDTKSTYYLRQRDRINQILGAPQNYHSFTSGILLTNRQFLNDAKHLWKKYIDSYDIKGVQDQGILNKCVLDIGKGYNILPSDWGAVNLRRTAKYIIHVWGFHKNGFNLERYCRRRNLKNPYNEEKK